MICSVAGIKNDDHDAFQQPLTRSARCICQYVPAPTTSNVLHSKAGPGSKKGRALTCATGCDDRKDWQAAEE